MDKYGYWPSYIYGMTRQLVQPFINTTFNINEIFPDGNVYIGDFASACNREALINFGITHIITAIRGVSEQFPNDFEYLLIDIGDTPDESMSQHFRKTNAFIDNALKSANNKVLIHCMYGVSRSATIACAYLIHKYKGTKNVSKVLELIRDSRPIVKPNAGFMNQLNNFYTKYDSLMSDSLSDSLNDNIIEKEMYEFLNSEDLEYTQSDQSNQQTVEANQSDFLDYIR